MPESIHYVPLSDPMPKPTPEHQRKITRGKVFEVVTVITLICTGTAFLYWRGQGQAGGPDAAETVRASIAAVEAGAAAKMGEEVLFGRHIWSFRQAITGFTAHVDLIGGNEDTPLETAIIWLTPQPGAGEPSEHTLQAAVNGAGLVAQLLVRSSGLAFEKAAKTMERINDSPRPHNKGVGATDDGWKLTYVTYTSHDEGADPPPMLCLVLQRLSAGEDESLAAMNRTMYEALQAGRDIKTVLREVENGAPAASTAS